MTPAPDWFQELLRAIDASGCRVTFDPKRSNRLPCVFCGSRDVRLVDLGRLSSGDFFTRPVCASCALEEATWAR